MNRECVFLLKSIPSSGSSLADPILNLFASITRKLNRVPLVNYEVCKNDEASPSLEVRYRQAHIAVSCSREMSLQRNSSDAVVFVLLGASRICYGGMAHEQTVSLVQEALTVVSKAVEDAVHDCTDVRIIRKYDFDSWIQERYSGGA